MPVASHAWRPVALAMFAVGWGANQFTPMLLVYEAELGLSDVTLTALFGIYAAGLIVGLLLGGPASDRRGRRPLVVPFVALSPVATALLMVGSEAPAVLAAGRLAAGAASGVVFAAASAWVQELSLSAPEGTGARRAAIALSAGFGMGPLVAALVAATAPAPLVVPYVAHVVLGVVALVLLLSVPETRAASRQAAGADRGRLVPAVARRRPFATVVAPMAPWVFGSASLAFAVLPAFVDGVGVALAGVIAAVVLGSGIAVQPLARQREPRAAGVAGLAAAVAGSVVGVAAAVLGAPGLVLLAAIPFGTAYGLILVSGLRESERLAPPAERGALVAVFYALTYTGFAAPFVLTGVAAVVGRPGALAVTAGLAAAVGVWLVRAGSGPPRPAHPPP